MKPDLDFELKFNVFADSLLQEVNLILLLEDTIDDNSQTFWDELIAHIANVVNHGGLSGSSINPISSSMAILESKAAGPHELNYKFEVNHIDLGAWRVIIGLYIASSYCSFPLKRMEMTSQNAAVRPILSFNRVWTTPFPKHPQPVPFLLEQSEEGDATRNRLIQIQFNRPLKEEEVSEVTSALLSWDELLMGGYPLDGQHPIENATDATEAYLIDPYTVENPLPNYIGSEDAFDAVVSMAMWFHIKLTDVKCVRIE